MNKPNIEIIEESNTLLNNKIEIKSCSNSHNEEVDSYNEDENKTLTNPTNLTKSNDILNIDQTTIIHLNKSPKLEKLKDSSCLKRILKFRGYLLGILAAFLLSFSKVILKKAPLLAGSDHTLIRYTIQFLFLFMIIKYKKLKIFGHENHNVRKLLNFRGLIGAMGMIFLHFAITLIAPSDTVAIAHSSVIITSILARLFLKEKFSIAHIFALVLTVAGILLISQPSFLFGGSSKKLNPVFVELKHQHAQLGAYLNQSNCSIPALNFEKFEDFMRPAAQKLNLTQYGKNSTCELLLKSKLIEFFKKFNEKKVITASLNYVLYLGIFFALCAAFTTGIVHTTIKKLCIKKVHYSVTIIYASFYGVPISLFISLILYATGVSYRSVENVNELLLHILYSVISGLFGLIAQICLNLALKYEEASKIAIIKTTDLIFTFLFQSYLVNIKKDFLNSLGAYLILLGTFLIFAFKFIEKRFNYSEKTKSTHLPGQNELNAKQIDESSSSKKETSCSDLVKMFIFFKF